MTGQIGNFMVIKNHLYIQYNGVFDNFRNNLNNLDSSWRTDLIKVLINHGKELPDPVFPQKERKILTMNCSVRCEDKEENFELCLRKIQFDDHSIGYYEMLIV